MASGTLLGICGSLRAGSMNRILMREAVRVFDPAEFSEGDLRLPLYDGDLESAKGIPDAVQRLADQIDAADAVVIATPEYNKMLPGVLKNGLDWVSRVNGSPWRDKPVAIVSATAGRAGGERAQWSLRLALGAFRPLVLAGPEVLIGQASSQFDADGRLTNERSIAVMAELMADLRAAAGLSTR